MSGMEQGTPQLYGVEPENPADDGTVIGIVGDVIEDFMEQDVPGSVVLVILAVILFREVLGAWMKWRRPPK